MMSDTQTLSLAAALVAGFVGSTHCFAMCGGFAGALGMQARLHNANWIVQLAVTQSGRVTSYALGGAIAGGVGTMLDEFAVVLRAAHILRAIAGLVLIAIAVRVAFAWNFFTPIERAGARFWPRLRPLAQRAMRSTRLGSSFLLGALWGWLPCGLVYSMLIYAALSAHAAQGALIMACFGLGTLPAMFASGALAGRVMNGFGGRSSRWIAATLLASFGLLTLFAVWPAAPHQHHL